jgi:hypothetical protein
VGRGDRIGWDDCRFRMMGIMWLRLFWRLGEWIEEGMGFAIE